MCVIEVIDAPDLGLRLKGVARKDFDQEKYEDGKIGEDEMLDDMFAREDTESTIPGMETTPKTTDPSVTQKAAQTMAQAEDPESTTLTDLNNTLMALLDAQNQNNRTAKKQQRSIEGLEI